jgi:rod shape-determining protein MreD
VNGLRVGVIALLVVAAVLIQVTVLSRLPLPGADPHLVLVLVVAVGLVRGPADGMLTGFGAGLLVDLLGVSAVGLGAVVLCLTGYVAGLLMDEVERSTLAPLLVVGGLSLAATLTYAALTALTGDPRGTVGALARALPASAAYDVVLAPFVVPAFAALTRRLDSEWQN